MFEKLAELLRSKASLTTNISGKPTEKDVQIATGVLLLQIAGADEDYAPEETEAIFRLMETQFHITNEEALEILETADAAREAQKTDEIVELINKNFNDGQKERLYAMIWRVILADGRVDKFESRLAAELRQRLQLTHEQHERAKKAAEMNRL